MSERKETDVICKDCDLDYPECGVFPENCKSCSHPADSLEVRNIEMTRDVKPKTLAEQTNGFTSIKDADYVVQQYHVGDIHYKVLVHCTKCNKDIYIFGVDPACR